MFSKSASGELSKWQICVEFDRFHSLTHKKGRSLLNILPYHFWGGGKYNYLFTTLSKSFV